MRIAAIAAERHVLDAKTSAPLRIALIFDNDTLLRLRGSGDGEAMVIDRLALEEPMDLGDHGRTEIFDFAAQLDRRLVDAEVKRLREIHNQGDKLIGLFVETADGTPYCFWVCGDEFCWGDEAALMGCDWLDEERPVIGEPVEV